MARRRTSNDPCQGLNAEGNPCGNNAKRGSDFCGHHQRDVVEKRQQERPRGGTTAGRVTVSAEEVEQLTADVSAESAMQGTWRLATAMVKKLQIELELAEQAGAPTNELSALRRQLGEWIKRNAEVLNAYLKSGVRERQAEDARQMANGYIRFIETVTNRLDLTDQQRDMLPAAIEAALRLPQPTMSRNGGEQGG